jgi:hypothetical protein
MDQTSGAPDDQTAWKGDQAPCVYCGQVIPRTSDRCPHCRTSFSLAVRKASREVLGPWYYLDPRNPSGRGVTFETLIKMIEKGRIRPDSIIRGPTTQQDWMYAAEVPRLAKYLGMCPHCFAEAKPEDTYCTHCQLNMNQRPAEARPGIPADLVKEPFHKAAYEMEKDLAREVAPSEQALAGEPFEAPTPQPASAVGAKPGAAAKSTTRAEVSATVAAAAAVGESAAAGERPSRIAAAQRRRKPKFWVVLVVTSVTLIPLLGIVLLTDLGGMRGALLRLVRPEETSTSQPGTSGAAAGDLWLKARLAEVDAAEQAHDYDAAVTILRSIIDKTGDASLDVRIAGIRTKAAEERRARLARLTERLNVAKKMAEDHNYDNALDVLRNIAQDDRRFLASLRSPSGEAIGIDVEKMEATVREDQKQYALVQKQEEQLASCIAQANQLVAAKRWPMALEAYKAIAADFPAEFLRKKGVDTEKQIKAIESQIAAAPTPPTPTTPTPTTPTPTPTTPTTPTPTAPGDVAAAIKALMDQANALDKAEKFADELAKLEEIKTEFEQKFWPEGLEERIKQVKAKKEAIEFFGMDSTKKPPAKTPPKNP